MRIRTPLAVGAVTLAMATTGFVATTTQSASSAAPTKSYAYGVSVGGQDGQPYAEYPGGPKSGGGNLPAELGPLAAGGVLSVSAGKDRANAELTNLTLGIGIAEQLPQEFKDGFSQLTQACTVFEQAGEGGADAAIDPLNQGIDETPFGPLINVPTTGEANEFCTALLDDQILNVAQVGLLRAECNGNRRNVIIENASVLGAEEPVVNGKVPANYSLLPSELDPAVKVTLNKQYTNGKGGSVVEALNVEVGGQNVATVSSATCGEALPAAGRAPEPAQAPAPEPVRQNVPVTG